MANLDAALDKDTTLTVSFSNPNDGIQVFYAYPMQGSAFRSPRFAPETGYATNYVMTRRMDDRSLYDDAAWEDLNYIFRVRTKCDAQGTITNALYGKIYGTLEHRINGAKGVFGCTYYLNPTPNDRNLEYDPKRNLFKGLMDENQLPREP